MDRLESLTEKVRLTFCRVDKETGESELMDLDTVQHCLMGHFKDVKLAVTDMVDNGKTLNTDFSTYRLVGKI